MKTYWLILKTALLFLLLAGCSPEGGKENTEPERGITISEEYLSLDAAASNSTINISAYEAWSASSNQSWCTISTTSGLQGNSSFTVSVSENTSKENSREASITFTAGTTTKVLKITQDKLYFIDVSKDQFQIKFGPDTLSFNTESNTDFTISTNSPWIILKENLEISNNSHIVENRIVFFAGINDNEQSRQATIVLTNKRKKLTKTVTVIQDGCPPDSTINPGGNIGNMEWE